MDTRTAHRPTPTVPADLVGTVLGQGLAAQAANAGWTGAACGPVGLTRDSDPLEASNWAVVTADLAARFPDSTCELEFSHWACGWIRELAHDTGDAACVAAVGEWRDRLADYGVADEQHYSELEFELGTQCVTCGEFCPWEQLTPAWDEPGADMECERCVDAESDPFADPFTD